MYYIFQNTPADSDLLGVGVEVEKICRCLLGHVHGSQTLLTMTLGRDYPFTFSLDQEYRRRRRYVPLHVATFPETLAMVSRAFLVGVTLGFSGLFPTTALGKLYIYLFRELGEIFMCVMQAGNIME